VVRSCFNNIRAITHLARKQKFLAEDPGEDVTMPITKISEKPVMPIDAMLRLLGAIEDLGDLCLMLVAIFSGPRASEAMGFQWKSWTGVSLMPYGTAVEGQFYEGRLKTKASRSPIAVPEPVRPVIEAWRRICSDPSPEALMFPTFGRGKRIGLAVPRHAKNFLRWRIKPIADRLEIPARLITFQVMRRSLGTHLSGHGTLKVALAKPNAGYVLSQRLHIEVDCSVAKGEVIESKIARFQNDDPAGETFLCHIVHVGLSLTGRP
jgi:integrase